MITWYVKGNTVGELEESAKETSKTLTKFFIDSFCGGAIADIDINFQSKYEWCLNSALGDIVNEIDYALSVRENNKRIMKGDI